MLAIVSLQLRGRRRAWTNIRTTRDKLRAFIAARSSSIDWLIADINVCKWYYTDGQWYRASKIRYIPGRLDLMLIKPSKLKFRTCAPL